MSLDLTRDKSTLVQVMACAVSQQAITSTNVDQFYMVSLGRNELIHSSVFHKEFEWWPEAECYINGTSHVMLQLTNYIQDSSGG